MLGRAHSVLVERAAIKAVRRTKPACYTGRSCLLAGLHTAGAPNAESARVSRAGA